MRLASLLSAAAVVSTGVVVVTASQSFRDGKVNVDCQVGNFVYGPCDAYGFQVRRRPVTVQPQGKGKACPVLEEKVRCKPVDCKVGPWSAFTACDAYDFKTRSREVITEPKNGGAACPALTEKVRCKKVDCKVCAWTPWKCDTKTGVKIRTRDVLVEPKDNGAPCPPLKETEPCDPIDCQMSDWCEWSACDEKTGRKTRSRKILRKDQFNGEPCGPLEEEDFCKPVPCVMNEWSSWSECAANDAGVWMRSRTRTIKSEPLYNAPACPPQKEEEECPKKDCKMTEWSGWSPCAPGDDGTWYQSRTRSVESPAENGGDPCGPTTEQLVCNKVNCQVSDWGEWTACYDAGNAGWIRKHTRSITVDPANGGDVCPPLEATEPCTKVDCVMSEFCEWSECAAGDDGVWRRTRSRHMTTAPENGGAACPPATETEVCPGEDCVLSDWTEWTPCAKDPSCDDWYQTRTRSVEREKKYNGKDCDSDRLERRKCLKVDCAQSEWSDWSECYLDGDKGWFQKQTRTVTTPPMYGGAVCGPDEQTKPCPPVDCVMTEWSTWSECALGDDGKWWKTQTRSITQSPMYDGIKCGEEVNREQCLPVDCTLGTWSEWTCDPKCGQQTRTRPVLEEAKYGGVCGDEIEKKPCDPVPCIEGDWTEWGECDQTCGLRTRTRPVLQSPLYDGRACDNLIEKKPCDPEPCVMTDWTQWGPCNDDGYRERTREIEKPAKWNGAPCGPTKETEKCPPENCVLSGWSDWSACDHQCGLKTRTRTIIHSPRFGGTACEALEEKDDCDPIPCVLSDWTEWSGCNCKSGQRTRTRTVTQFPRYGGAVCEALEENEKCEPTDCKLGNWGEWSSCDPETKTETRTRQVITFPRDGGATCGPTTETRSCAPVPCAVSPWSEWSECDTSCGKKTRTRTITRYPENGGRECPSKLVDKADCDPQDCKLKDTYLPWGVCCQTTCMQTAQLEIIQHAKYGGKECNKFPGFEKHQRCFEGECKKYAIE